MDLTLQNGSASKNIPSKSQFKNWACAALGKKIAPMEITIRIVSPKESAKLNKYYRHKNKPTNVLSFPYENGIGDLVICAAIVKSEAKAQKKLLLAHWAHITIHGILHLIGYDHIKSKDADKMEALEIKIMKHLGFENPY